MAETNSIQTLKDTGSDYPISSNVDGAVYRLISKDCIIGEMGDQFKITYSATSLILTFSKGCQALIGGNAFWLTSDTSITLPANSSNFYVCLRIDTSKPNGWTGSIECLTDAAIKTGNINNGGIRDLKLYKVTTSASGVTSCTDLRNIVDDTKYATETYVDNAIETAIGDAIGGDY